MRVGFIQINRNSSTEYLIHKQFAELAEQYGVESFFFWQKNIAKPDWGVGAFGGDVRRNFYFDFGRDFFRPRPPFYLDYFCKTVSALPKLISTVRQLNLDLLYTSQQRWDILLTHWLSRKLGIPYVAHVNYPISPKIGNKAISLLQKSPHILASSDFVRTTAIQNQISADRVTVIYNVTNTAPFLASHTNNKDVLTQFNIPQNKTIIVSAGRLDPKKGQADLVEAVRYLVQQNQDVHLLLCGSSIFSEPGYENYVRQLVEQYKLQPYVTFTGFRTDLPAMYRSADIFALPAKDEAFGLVFTEAMAAGLPIVTYRSGSTPELIPHGLAGYLCPEGDIPAFASALSILANDPQLRAKMGSYARRYVQTTFDNEQLAYQWAQYLFHIRAKE